MTAVEHADATILVVDDEAANLELFARILSAAGYRSVLLEQDPAVALNLLSLGDPIDLVVLDMHMPKVDGITFLRRLEALHLTLRVPVIVVTGDPQTKLTALDAGADDFLTRPIDRVEVGLRVRNLLRTRALQRTHADRADLLGELVRERTADLETSRQETLDALGRAAEYRDDDTHEHTQRVGENSARLASAVGFDATRAEVLRLAAPLHDVGKIGIPDSVLLKRGPLTPEEFALVKAHTTIGAAILGNSDSAVLRLAETIALAHHERWDGNGYAGLKGVEIPIEARVVSVVDVFDALTHERPYKPPWSIERTREELLAQRGLHFDPEILDVFLGLIDRGGLLIA